jgi:hypothetical protein
MACYTYNPLLEDDDEVEESMSISPTPVSYGIPAIFGDSYAKDEPSTKPPKNRKKQPESPVVITATQHEDAMQVPQNFHPPEFKTVNKYSPTYVTPSHDLFTKEMFPVEQQRVEEDLPFIHFEDKEDRKSNPMTITQKVEENLKQKEIQDAAAKKFIRSVAQEVPKKTYFDPAYRNPFRYIFVTRTLQVPAEDSLAVNRIPHQNFARPKMEAVPRRYDEEFLMEPVGSQRPCVNGSACLGCKIPSEKGQKVILREYFLPSQYEICKQKACWPDDLSECILCMLNAVNMLFFNTKGDQMGIDGDSVIASFYHKVGEPTEYRIEDCISNTEKKFLGCWGPILIVNLNNYEYTVFDVPDPQVPGGIRKVRGFRLNLPYPAPETTQFFQRGSLAPEILEGFARL